METSEVYKKIMKWREAYYDIPKMPYKMVQDETSGDITLSCPQCGICFARFQPGYFTFKVPQVCCGYMLV